MSEINRLRRLAQTNFDLYHEAEEARLTMRDERDVLRLELDMHRETADRVREEARRLRNHDHPPFRGVGIFLEDVLEGLPE